MKPEILKCIVVDSSYKRLMNVTSLVDNHSKLTLVAKYCNVLEARNGIKNATVDLIFLQIDMPIINGFDLLDSISHKPQIIFISDDPVHALRAFEYDVTDYLQKPIGLKRFDRAVNRALKNHITFKETHDDVCIYVGGKSTKTSVVLNQIKWIEAFGDYVKVVTDDNIVLEHTTMKYFQKRLPKHQFLKIHRSYIVNIDRVKSFSHNTLEVSDKQLPISRHLKQKVERVLISA